MDTRAPNSCRSRLRARCRRGFTLIEAAMVTVIVGVGTVGMLQLLATGTIANNDSYHVTSALNLANNVRELTQGQSFDAVLAMNGRTISPPVDARNRAIAQYTNPDGKSPWAQSIKVEKVDENRITVTVPNTTDTPTARVTVSVTNNGKEFCSLNWLIVKTD